MKVLKISFIEFIVTIDMVLINENFFPFILSPNVLRHLTLRLQTTYSVLIAYPSAK